MQKSEIDKRIEGSTNEQNLNTLKSCLDFAYLELKNEGFEFDEIAQYFYKYLKNREDETYVHQKEAIRDDLWARRFLMSRKEFERVYELGVFDIDDEIDDDNYVWTFQHERLGVYYVEVSTRQKMPFYVEHSGRDGSYNTLREAFDSLFDGHIVCDLKALNI